MPMTLPDDPIILELLPEFVDDWIIQLDRDFHSILERKSEQELYRLGHTLKGSCLQFGLQEPAQLGIQLMGLSKEQKWDEAATLFEPIRAMFTDAQVVIKQRLTQL
jgi:HPt (histidine-containing phosphotransfer) domain-containing protein